jgi:hypothetical protein
MATAAKNLFSSIHHHHSSRSSTNSSRKPEKRESADDYKKGKEDEKHFIASWEAGSQKTPLSPVEVAKDPALKQVGSSTKHLQVNDFKFLKTLGTGAQELIGPRMNVAHLSARYIREGILGQVIKSSRWGWRDCVRTEGFEEV